MASTSHMKSMTELSSAIKTTTIPSDVAVLQKLLSSLTAATTALNALPSEYSRAYSEVQLLRYDDDNYPEDVTDEYSQTIPESVIARYKQSWDNILENIASLKGQLEDFVVREILDPESLRVEWSSEASVFHAVKFQNNTALINVLDKDGNSLADFLASHFQTCWNLAIQQLGGSSAPSAVGNHADFMDIYMRPFLIECDGIVYPGSMRIIPLGPAQARVLVEWDGWMTYFIYSNTLNSNLSSFRSSSQYLRSGQSMSLGSFYVNNGNWTNLTINNPSWPNEASAEITAHAETEQMVGENISMSIDLTSLDTAMSNLASS